MKASKALAGLLMLMTSGMGLMAQDKPIQKNLNPAAVPPNLLLLVRQEVQPGRATEHQKLEVGMARTADRLDVPSYWIELQSMSGTREAVFFNPFDSFERLEGATFDWLQLVSSRAEIARLQEQIDALVTSERTVVALRRDDLGYLAETINLSEARFVRMVEIRVISGHETDFVRVFQDLGETYAKAKMDRSWVVYQVNAGMPAPAFLVLVPMASLSEDVDLVSSAEELGGGEMEVVVQQIKQLEREAFASTESNLYLLHPEMSHVSRDFAAGDPDFWRRPMKEDGKPEGVSKVSPPKRKP